jgi:four helix bundle protein
MRVKGTWLNRIGSGFRVPGSGFMGSEFRVPGALVWFRGSFPIVPMLAPIGTIGHIAAHSCRRSGAKWAYPTEIVGGTGRALRYGVAGARDHTELDAWKLADELRTEINRLVELRPLKIRPRLVEELLDSAESACANLAEGFSRYLPRDFARFVRISRGSLSEIIDRPGSAVKRRLLSEEEITKADVLARRSRGACTKLIIYLEGADPPNRD